MARSPAPESLVVVRLWEAQQAFEAALEAELAELGVTLAEFRLVGVLRREPGGLRQRELARRLGVRPPTVSAAVNRLTKSGLLEQSTDEADQRARLVRITRRAPIKSGADVLARLEARALASLSPRDRRMLDRLLANVLTNLRSRSS